MVGWRRGLAFGAIITATPGGVNDRTLRAHRSPVGSCSFPGRFSIEIGIGTEPRDHESGIAGLTRVGATRVRHGARGGERPGGISLPYAPAIAVVPGPPVRAVRSLPGPVLCSRSGRREPVLRGDPIGDDDRDRPAARSIGQAAGDSPRSKQSRRAPPRSTAVASSSEESRMVPASTERDLSRRLSVGANAHDTAPPGIVDRLPRVDRVVIDRPDSREHPRPGCQPKGSPMP